MLSKTLAKSIMFIVMAVVSVAFGFEKLSRTDLDAIDRWFSFMIAVILGAVLMGAAFGKDMDESDSG